MPYSSETIDHLQTEAQGLHEKLQRLQLNVIAEGQPLPTDSLTREHLLHGVGRRLSVIRRSIQNIFDIFPPDATKPLDADAIADVQINLHAFLMNVYGIFDNWGWAFVLRHDLLNAVGGKKGVGLFAKKTQQYLPEPLKAHVTGTTLANWHDQYAKSFRDALAHRIPPYIPPATFTKDEAAQYSALEDEKIRCIRAHNWTRLDEVWEEQAAIGRACFDFLHAYNEDEAPEPVMLHPQLICDGLALVEFGDLFLQHWGSANGKD